MSRPPVRPDRSRARRPRPCLQRSVSTSPAWERLKCGPCHGTPAQISVSHMHSPLVPRFELWADHETTSKLLDALQIAGAHSAKPKAWNGCGSLKERLSTPPTSATASSPRRPDRPAPCTSPKAATSARRSSSASVRAAMSTAHSAHFASTEISPLPAPRWRPTANRSAN